MSRSYKIALLPGDGIGPEVMDSALAVLQKAAALDDLSFAFTEYEAGANYYKKSGLSISLNRWKLLARLMLYCWAQWACRLFVNLMAPKSLRKSTCASTTACLLACALAT